MSGTLKITSPSGETVLVYPGDQVIKVSGGLEIIRKNGAVIFFKGFFEH